MSANPSCNTCRYFDQATDLVRGSSTFICRLRPPVAVAIAAPGPQGMQIINATTWPQVKASDWCSEHKVHLAS